MTDRRDLLTYFILGLLASHFMALVFLNGFENGLGILVLLVFFCLCLAWREYFFADKSLFNDFIRARYKWQRQIVAVFGIPFEDQSIENREDEEWQELVLKRAHLKTWIFVAVSIALCIFLLRGRSGVEVTWPRGFLPALMAGTIMAFSSHAAFLALALFISVLMVLYGFWTKSSPDSVSIEFSLYVISLFFALMMYARLEMASSFRRQLLSTLRAALIFLIFVGIFQYLIPERQAIQKKPIRAVVKPIVEKGIRRAAEHYVNRTSPPVGGGPGGVPGGQSGMSRNGGASGDLADLERQIQQAEAELRDAGVSKEALKSTDPTDSIDGGKLNPEDLEKARKDLAGKLEQVQNTAPNPPAGPDVAAKDIKTTSPRKNISPEDLKKAMENLARLKQVAAKSAEKSSGAGNGSAPGSAAESGGGSGRNRSAGRGAGGRSGDGPGGGTGAEAGPASDAAPDGKTQAAETAPERSLEKNATESHGSAKLARDVEKKRRVEDLQKWLSKRFDMFYEIAKVLLVVGALIFIISFFLKATAKPKPQDANPYQLHREQRKNLRRFLSAMKSRKLPPDEEIIETYNLVLKVFETADRVRPEDLPVRIFSDQVKKEMPSVGAPFSTATDCFEGTLYGGEPVAAERIQTFRQSVQKIMRYFDIAV